MTPAALAQRIIPGYRITPTVALISDAPAEAVNEPDRRVIITTPPRTGKSVQVSQTGPLYALMRNPDSKVILASYADTLAQEHSHAARGLVGEHADLLGFGLRADKTAVGRWRVDGHDGGLLAAGILSGITGFGADLLLIDDPIKNAQEADSPAHRRRVLYEFRSTLMTRLHPGASVVVIGTGDYCYGLLHPDQIGFNRPGPTGFRDQPIGIDGLYLVTRDAMGDRGLRSFPATTRRVRPSRGREEQSSRADVRSN